MSLGKGEMKNSIEAVVSIGKRNIPYKVVTSKRARRLRLTVSAAGVSVTLPYGIQQAEAEKFIRQNEVWILSQLERVERDKGRKNQHRLPEDVILFHGEPHQIQVIREADRKSRLRIEESKGRLRVYAPAEIDTLPRIMVEPWLKSQARDEIEMMVKQQALRMKASPKKVTIRDQRTRWGSCSGRGTLSFNWRLIMAPPSVMEYVVIHEIAHLFEPNHSRAFWSVVATYAPSYKPLRTWLRKNAILLRPDLN